MSQPLKLMRESFSLLGKNLVLFYPVLGFLMIMDFIRPRLVSMPDLDMRWILIFSVLLLLKAAFAAGWFGMVYEVTFKSRIKKQAGLKKDTFRLRADITADMEKDSDSSEGSSISESLSLFKQFFPAIGDYFLSFTLGLIITTGVFFLVFWLVQQDIQNSIGYPTEIFNRLSEFIAQGSEAQGEMQTYIEKMPLGEQEQLSAFLSKQLVGVFASLLFVILTIFWIPIMMIRRVTVLKAFWQSVLFFLKDPLRLTAMGVAYGLSLLLLLLMSSFNWFFSMVFVFFAIFLGIAVGIFLFLYVLDECGDDLGLAPGEIKKNETEKDEIKDEIKANDPK